MTLHLALQCVIKLNGRAEFLLLKKKKKSFDVKIPTLTPMAAQLQKKSFPSIPSVIASVFRFLCENDG